MDLKDSRDFKLLHTVRTHTVEASQSQSVCQVIQNYSFIQIVKWTLFAQQIKLHSLLVS